MLSRMLAFGAHRLPRVKGKDRLFRAAIRTSSKHEKFVIERAGVRYEVGGDDLIDYYLMANDFESPIVVEALAKHIGDRQLCLWDIGANVGGVALPLLRC